MKNTQNSGVILEAITNPAKIPAEAVDIYCQAYAGAPYFESFTGSEAAQALELVLDNDGDLLVGRQDDEIVAVAGGYPRPDGTYYLAELAVRPDRQNSGIGKKMFRAQLDAAARRGPSRVDLRTSVGNVRGLSIYGAQGFKAAIGNTVVSQLRQDGKIGLDERLYMYKPPVSDEERLSMLRRAAIAYPSGNTTGVVFDQLLNQDRKSLNEQVMDAWRGANPEKPQIEQCCFVTLPKDPAATARVEMFGGEFCGNATRSVIWLVTEGKDYEGLIEVSGVDRPLAYRVKDGEVRLEMPLPDQGELVRMVPEGELVQLDGIAQLVVTNPGVRSAQSARELLQRLLCNNRYALAEQPAVGVSYYDQESGKAEFCVWVKEVNTVFDETACGSGTSAIGVATAAREQRNIKLNVIQPSGESIATEAEYGNGKVAKSAIAGTVSLLYDGALRLV